MAGLCRCCRRCRWQAPSRISSRNRNVCYLLLALTLVTVILMIPGSEIAHFKYAEGAEKDEFLTSFTDNLHGEDGVIREQRSLHTDTKVVLLWNDFFASSTWRLARDPFPACPVSTCQLTTDRTRLAEADAVMFNARSITDPADLPEEHPHWQVWILHNSEPPYFFFLDLPRYNNIFNWTSSYRTDADIFSPYGGYVKKQPDVHQGHDNDNRARESEGADIKGTDESNVTTQNVKQVSPQPRPDVPEDLPDIYGLHDLMIHWAASYCPDRGRRYTRVASIAKYLPVDTFGECGDFPCVPGSEECEDTLVRYQFVLAFENGYCRDYVTEKLWNAYFRLQIPIVSGGAYYARFAIPNSYIDYDNFTTVEDLVDYIEQVSADRELYNSYFEWMRYYTVVRAPVANWCQICEALHDRGRQPQVYSDLEGWMAQDSCPLYSRYAEFWSNFYLGVFKVLGI